MELLIEFTTKLLLFYILAYWLRGMWDSYLPDQGPNLHPVHWEAVFTTREVLVTWCCARISLVLIGGGPGWGMGEVSEDYATKKWAPGS